MKSYACLKCGKGLAGSECVNQKGRWVIRQLCPACGAAVCLSGGALILFGLVFCLVLSVTSLDALGMMGGTILVLAGLLVMARLKWTNNQRHPS